jgi:GMP synthase-like glutamine amidotransferase
MEADVSADDALRALVIRHDHGSGAAEIGTRLAEHGYAITDVLVVPEERFLRPDVEFTFPHANEWDLIVVFGAPWSVYDERAIGSWIHGELALLREAQTLGVPLLCVCFGAQSLATALGGRVEKSPVPEVGWTSVESDDEALVPSGPWFQWHYDRCVPPPDAEIVARNAVCVQAWRLGRSLAVQFHPELTAAMLQDWLDLGGTAECAGLGIDPAGLMTATRAQEPAARRRARALVDAFLAKIAAG